MEEGKLLTKVDKFGDGTNGPVVVVEDESTTRIIGNLLYFPVLQTRRDNRIILG